MSVRLVHRLDHITQAIDHVRLAMAGKQASDLDSDAVLRAAFERFIEIISEASRYIPAEMKARYPNIPWPDIANFGNHLRHVYHRIDRDVLWSTYQNDLDPLYDAVCQLRAGLSSS